ncbi:MAG: hypothetical protein Q9168_006597 [Polycauliona sp. 1 TL-2023]
MAPRDIESLLPQLLSFPPHPPARIADTTYDKDIRSLRKVLNDIPASLLTAGVPNGGDLLDVSFAPFEWRGGHPTPSPPDRVSQHAYLPQILDPSINTLPYLYVLLAHSNAGKQKVTTIGSSLWHKALDFLHRFDAVQVRYVGTEFRRLIMFVKDVALAGDKPIAAVRPLGTAILRLDPAGSCFTSTHLVFVQLCLEARTFSAAKPVIDKDIYELPSSAKTVPDLPCSRHDTSSGFITDKSELSDTFTYRDPLLYFLYGAMIYLALKEWPRAILYLEVVLTAPAKLHTSQIQVEAYKKWVLANLLANGEVPNSLPKTISPQVAKHVRTLGRAYETLGIIFHDGISKEHVVRRLNAEDNNLMLVLQVLDAFRQFTIAKLESTYAALPLSEVSKRTSSDSNDHAETAQYIAGMIHSGQLNATIQEKGTDHGSWVLRFTTSTSRSEQHRNEELKRQVAKAAKVADHVRETDRKLSLNRDYIGWLKQKAEVTAAANTGEDPGMMALEQTGFEEEDLLGR